MDGNALEVAIALWRSPTRRVSLRQQPLPADVGEVIELAAGAPERLAQAAARTGERPEQLLEAVRFYLREVLLFDSADFYRVLGVADDAPHARIKAHHRALQHWLHPDRPGDDWEAIYATRINAAWAELRFPKRRAAYDARVLRTRGAIAAAPHRILVSDWRAAPADHVRWRGWLGVGVTVATCVWLAVLVDRQASAPAPEWSPAATRTVDRDSDPPGLAQTVPVEPARSRAAPAPVVDPPVPSATPTLAEIGMVASPPANQGLAKPASIAPATSGGDPDAQPASASAPAPAPGRVTAGRGTPTVVPAPPQSPPRAGPTASATRAPVAAPLPELDPEQVRLVIRRGRDVTRYLASTSDHVPPIWHSVVAQDAAASIRERLDGSGTRFGEPVWHIAPGRARMTSAIDGDDAGATTLRVGLGWREGMWLVESIAMDPRP